MSVVSSLSILLRLIFSKSSLPSSGTLYTTAPIPLNQDQEWKDKQKVNFSSFKCLLKQMTTESEALYLYSITNMVFFKNIKYR